METFEKIRAANGLEDFRAELIEEIERLISLTAGAAVKGGSASSSETSFNLIATCEVINGLEDRLTVMAEKSENLNGQRQKISLKDHRAELYTRISLIETWQRNWLELLIYLYSRKASLRLTGTPEFKKACKDLLSVYAMLPYSFARSKKLLENHTRGTQEI